MHELQADDRVNNRYRVIRKLGAGAMGSVYLCEDCAERNIKVALKVLISENLDDQDIWAKGEYEALTRLRHPNLAKVHNFGRLEGTNDYFIVSEFIKGVDLFSATEYLRYDEITDIVVQICRALEYIHSQGYVHFDIKPDNILVSRQRTLGIKDGSKVQYEDVDLKKGEEDQPHKPIAKLIDFGLAEKITGSFNFAIKGTLNYLAPEILNGATPDKRADLYSLGVTIYQCVNRDLPFYQDFRFGTNYASHEKRVQLFEANMKKHPDYLRGVILKLLEESPDERFQSAKDVIQYINRNSGHVFELETEETRASYFHSPRLVGRKRELNLLKERYESIFLDARRSGTGEAEGDAPQSEVAATLDDDTRDQDEFQELLESVRSLEDDDPIRAADEAHFVLVTGQMGAGKSRLLEEFQHFLKLNDVQVFCGNCYESNHKAYQPLIEVFRQLIFSLGPSSWIVKRYEDYIHKLLPELAPRSSGSSSVSLRPEKEKQCFIDKLAQFVVDAAEVMPFVFCVNNLHWIDDASVDLLEKIYTHMQETVRERGSLRLIALASQRSEEQRNERLKELLEMWKASGFCVEAPIRRLKRQHIQEFIQSTLGLSDVPADFAAQLEEQTGGNPLFLVETLKALQDEGILKHQGDGWSIKTTKYSKVEIPSCMEDLLQKRLTKLDPINRQVLEAMAVLNKAVSPKFLQRFKRFASTPILVQLRDLEEAGLVHKLFEGGKLHFDIEQPKVREILYAQLSVEERCRYHGEVGAAYEEEYRNREEEILEELAFHYQRSDRPDRAIRFALRAGDRLKGIYANERAHEYYCYVLEQIADQPEYVDLYFEVREKLGDICMAMGRYEAAAEHFSALLVNETRDMLPPESVTKLYLRLGKVSEIQGDYDRALHCYKDARNYLSVAGRDDRLLERAKVYNSIGWIYVCMGKYEKAMTISLEALRVIQRELECLEHAMIYSTIGMANFYKGNVKEAVRYHAKSLQIKEHLEDITEIIISLNNLGESFLAGADYGEAFEQFQRALVASEEVGDPYGRAMALHNMAHLYACLGQAALAHQFLDESIDLSKTYNMRFLSLRNYTIRGQLLLEQKDWARAESNFFRVLSAFSKQGNRAGLCDILLRMAALHRHTGNLDEARAMVDEGRRYAEDLGLQNLRVRCCLEEARVTRMEVEPNYQKALGWLEEGIALATKTENPELIAEVHFELAETLVSMHDLPRATQHYRAAQERFREITESLPEGFRAEYDRAMRERFPNWSDDTPPVRPAQAEGLASTKAQGTSSRANAEDSLRMVSELMQSLPTAASLTRFLTDVLERLFDVTGAKLGYILSLTGRSLSIKAAHHALGGDLKIPAGKILCLPIIDRALKSQQPVVIEQVWKNPEVTAMLEDSGFPFDALAVFPFLEPDGKRGALYLVNPTFQGESSTVLLIQPFLNLVPVSYLHFQSQVVEL